MTDTRYLVAAGFITLTGFASTRACKSDRSDGSSPAPQAQPAKKKDPEAARAAIVADAVVIDVRTPDEFAEGHLPSAINVPVEDLGARLADVDTLVAGDKAKTIVVYCAAGGRASRAREALESTGYTHVINGGGLDDLR